MEIRGKAKVEEKDTSHTLRVQTSTKPKVEKVEKVEKEMCQVCVGTV